MEQAADPDMMLLLVLLALLVLTAILWIRNRRQKKQIKELKEGRWPSTRWHKLLVALGIRKKYKPPHGGFKKGDVNIKVYRTCKKR